jgi:UPF0042 nucleotide-binding protein
MATPRPTRFVIVTGLSGAGKGQALRFLEDLGYYCVDNLPAQLIPNFADLLCATNTTHAKIAVCLDSRAGQELQTLPAHLDAVRERGIRPEVLYLESNDKVLVRRYSETRRRHPLAPAGSIEEGIAQERALLEPVRARADLVLDTSSTSVSELRERIAAAFLGERPAQGMFVTVMSFGFKYGVPAEADLVFDARFLPNPFYDAELRPRTGEDPDVREFVLANKDGAEFLERIKGLLKFLVPRYAAEPKTYLTIAVGCTGGQHRSVAIAHDIGIFLRGLKYDVRLRHRDIARTA